MRVLIGTDILVYYLLKQELEGIAMMFKWMERVKATRFTDVSSIAILTNLIPLDAFSELRGLNILKRIRPKARPIVELEKRDKEGILKKEYKYKPTLAQLNWLYYNDVDCLITENRLTHHIAQQLGIDDIVLSIEDFIEKCSIEHPELDETRGVAIQKIKFGELDINDNFFNSFKEDYEPYYHLWFKKKANDDVYIAKDSSGKLRGLLKLKIESQDDDFGIIKPSFRPAKRLKICSLKADFTGQKLGQRFMRIVFETALEEKADEIYITLFPSSPQRKRLISMIEQWGFRFYGIKDKNEYVFLRSFRKDISDNPQKCFPFCSFKNNSFIIPIAHSYATQLLPPFGFGNEENIFDVEPVKQAIKKVLIMHENTLNIQRGSILLFLQKANTIKITSLGIVDNVYKQFSNESHFISRCRKRSCFSNETLHSFWLGTLKKPVVVEFLYACHFEKEVETSMIEAWGIDTNNIKSQYPIPVSDKQTNEIIKDTPYEKIIVTHTS